MERAEAEQLLVFLDDASVLDSFQSGFHPGRGTETVLVALTGDLWKHLDWGMAALLVLLDLTAEFDMVDHNLLTHCLVNAGAWGTALQWFSSFLQAWGQSVALSDTHLNVVFCRERSSHQ